MKKNIVYSICDYRAENREIFNRVHPLLRHTEAWAHSREADFMVIREIPNVIHSLHEAISSYYSQHGEGGGGYIDTLIGKGRELDKHILMAWNTKFFVLQHFYQSSYENMLYLDCDHTPKANNDFSFREIERVFYMVDRPRLQTGRDSDALLVTEEHLRRKIEKRFRAGIIVLSKQFEVDLSNLFSYDDLFDLWKMDSRFVREETAMNYLLHKHDVVSDMNTKIEFSVFNVGRNDSKLIFQYDKHFKSYPESYFPLTD